MRLTSDNELNEAHYQTDGVKLCAELVYGGCEHIRREKLGVSCVERGENEAAENESEYPAPNEAFASADNCTEYSVCLAQNGKLGSYVQKLEDDLENDQKNEEETNN